MAKGTSGARIALAFRGRLLAVILAAGAGAAGGLGFFTFVYAKGFSYLTDDPKACANCHVMTEQYDGWAKGSHRSV
ncbi:MAG: cytochrome c nitrite reductase small subunit, partial [Myxococcota bacterium]|nr:cytochrome c nitrite reductase small subunit [Myxococcota bacterium]